MKKFFWIISFALLAFSCSVEELKTPENNDTERVYARIESVDETATRVYADENLKVLWDADDRISLFKKSTYNKQYRFTGSTGANSGEFVDVNPDAVVTGNPLDNVYSVYPYKSETTISNDGGVISTTLPAEQTYREGSFGIGANTMVSATTNTELVFKNLCGYIVLKLYGENVSVASITLTGKNNEPLAGGVNVTASVGNDPSFAFSGTTTTSLTLNCPTPVTLGTTAEQATTFWLVTPPTTFTNGFTVTVTDKNGRTFEKSSSSKTVISRNSTFRMKPLAVEIEYDPDYSKEYLSFHILNNGEIGWKISDSQATIRTIDYSINGGDWTSITPTTEGASFAVLAGDIVRFRGRNNSYCNAYLFHSFTSSCEFNAMGNIMSLIEGDSFDTATSLSGNLAFYGLFMNCTGLKTANNLILPATSLSNGCYQRMFQGCSSLSQAPVLPATTLVDYCYTSMFWGCSSLISAPELPARALANDCYRLMFKDCVSLTSTPNLPATTLFEDCYAGMFNGCTSLVTVCELPALSLSYYGYSGMFANCTSLTIAPALPATTLAENCYDSMFANCTSLVTPPALPATTLKKSCYSYMFSGCTALPQAPVLPAPSMEEMCYEHMFYNCSNLSFVKCLATKGTMSLLPSYNNRWLENVAPSGTFVKAKGIEWPVYSNGDGIPKGWTVEEEDV